MDKRDCALIIDAGSSSIRASLIDERCNTIKSFQYRYRVVEFVDGRVEQCSETYIKALKTVVSSACTHAVAEGIVVQAVAVTSQRSSVVPVDRENKPLFNFIMWQDKRTVELCKQINDQTDIYPICGMKATHVYSAPKILWFYTRHRDIYDKTYKFVGVQDLMLREMIGKFVIDRSFASRTALLDIRTLEWSEDLLELFHADKDKLCELVDVSSCVGQVTKEFSRQTGLREGCPVYSVGGDQQCAALGMNISEKGQIMVNTGTGAYAVAVSDRPILDPNENVLCNVSSMQGQWILEISSLSSGVVFDWMRENLFKDETCESEDKYAAMKNAILRSSPGANGVLSIPNLLGKGAPSWNPYIRGAFFNISFRNNRDDLARAMLEALAAELCECVKLLQGLLGPSKKILSSGGLSRFAYYNQILSDMLGEEVTLSSVPEVTTIGAWVALACSLGMYSDPNHAHRVFQEKEESIFHPDPELRQVYENAGKARHILETGLEYQRIHNLLT